MHDALGTSLEEICKVVPLGYLVFFPSYKLIDKFRSRWSETGQWARLNAQKPVFVGEVILQYALKSKTMLLLKSSIISNNSYS